MAGYQRCIFGGILAVCLALLLALSGASTEAQDSKPTSTPTEPSDIATIVELAQAYAAWEGSGHADTFDNGFGADTTCARCKSPFNWDPTHPAADAALNCASCKRIPGEERPILEGGDQVPKEEWHDIGCPVCHEPVGDSFRITPSYWNQELGAYEPVEEIDELCAHCHEGQHGFEVIEEMDVDRAHQGWHCIDCHDPHGDNIQCIDCHDTTTGPAAEEHANHTQVHCSGCHDRGGLGLWQEHDPDSHFYTMFITRRFAHTLTSWPSHNLQTEVDCRRCHHAGNDYTFPALSQDVSCDNAACHPSGAVLYWCPYLPRDAAQ